MRQSTSVAFAHALHLYSNIRAYFKSKPLEPFKEKSSVKRRFVSLSNSEGLVLENGEYSYPCPILTLNFNHNELWPNFIVE